VRMRSRINIRFDYGSTIPWVTRLDDGTLRAIAGPQMLLLKTPAALRGEDFTTVSEFTVEPGQRIPFVLRHASSHLRPPDLPDPFAALDNTERFWAKWVSSCTGAGRWSKARCSFPDHAQGAYLRAHRRNRGSSHDFLAGEDRRPKKLGLPVLLGA